MLQSVTHYEVMLVKSCRFCLTLPLEISRVLTNLFFTFSFLKGTRPEFKCFFQGWMKM